MSFSEDCKKELSRVPMEKECCRLSELSGLFATMGQLNLLGRGRVSVQFSGENMAVCRRVYLLLVKQFRFSPQIHYVDHPRFGGSRKCVLTLSPAQSPVLLCALRMMEKNGEGYTLKAAASRLPIARLCDMRAYLRGVFLGGGTVSAPQGDAHLELPCRESFMQNTVARCLQRLELPIHFGKRREHLYTYLKQSEQIVTLLGQLGASAAVMQLEEMRVKKQVFSQVTRMMNCDHANVQKTVAAGTRQLEAIRRLDAEGKLEGLPPALQEIARKRLEAPEATLAQLGEMLTPPVGRSGVNHRLRRLMALAGEEENP